MSLAITLLTAVAVGSVIGSVLQQDQTWPDYFAHFGPFWFEVFRVLGLYEVYAAPWFVALLLFLVGSTAVCIIRRTPDVLRDVRGFRLQRGSAVLRALPGARTGITDTPRETLVARATEHLHALGYRTRRRDTDDGSLVGGVRGQWGRLGDLLIHFGIVVIALGALIDANLPLHVRAAMGGIDPQPEDAELERFQDGATLSPSGGAFRGQVTVPEGQDADVAYVPIRDGYVLQSLPFGIEVLDFRVTYYPDGRPRQYESDVRLHGPGDARTEGTLAVNEPLRHAGHTLYQSSFEDGGSRLQLRARPLRAAQSAQEFSGQVGGASQVRIGESAYTLEFQSLELRNPRPDVDAGSGAFRDAGPALQYRLRSEDGRAVEVRAYQKVQESQGEGVFLSGVRHDPDARFRYLEIPADADGSPDGFLELLGAIHDPEWRRPAARQGVATVLSRIGVRDPELEGTLSDFVERLLVQWVREGEDAVEQQATAWVAATSQDPQTRALLSEVVSGVLIHGFDQLYADLADAGEVPSLSHEERQAFVQRAAPVLADVAHYPVPLLLQLDDFQVVQASGIQVARAPGQPWVVGGAIGLVVGLILLLYVPRHRLWVRVDETPTGRAWCVAAQASRGASDAAGVEAVARRLPADPSASTP